MERKRTLHKNWKCWLLLSALCIGLLTGCGENHAESEGGQSAQAVNIQEPGSSEAIGMYQADSDSKDIPTGESSQETEGTNQQTDSLSSPEESDPLEEMEVHFMDMGQGDATLIMCGGQNLLIDTAESDKGTAIQNYLTKQGVEKLDYLILTHPDADHIGAAPVIITKFEIDHVFMSNFEKDNKTYQKLIQALDNKRITAETPQVGTTFTLGTAVCTILAPNRTYEDPNDASVAVFIQNGENKFLFTGDAEEAAEKDILENGLELQADVYQAGHHGSRTSSSPAFLDAVQPKIAVISCGEGNSYGHPHAQTLNEFRSRGIAVYRTDEQGSIVAISDGSSISWNASPSETWKSGEPTGSSNQKNESTVQLNSGQEGNTTALEAESSQASIEESNPQTITYILNTKTKKFHVASCSYLPTANRKDSESSREDLIAQGYEPCKKCNP